VFPERTFGKIRRRVAAMPFFGRGLGHYVTVRRLPPPKKSPAAAPPPTANLARALVVSPIV